MVALICSICDIILMLIGTLGVSNLISYVVKFKIILGLIGVALLLYYAIIKLGTFYNFQQKLKIGNQTYVQKKNYRKYIWALLCLILISIFDTFSSLGFIQLSLIHTWVSSYLVLEQGFYQHFGYIHYLFFHQSFHFF